MGSQTPSVMPAVGKGCLGGLALAVVFFVISGSVFLLLRALGLPQNYVWLFSVASGPIIGITGTLFFVSIRLRANPTPAAAQDETTSGDAA